MNTPRSLLVTGAAGFLGRAAVRRLVTLDTVERVVAVDVRPGVPGEPKVRAVTADVRTLPVSVLEGVDAVIHLAFVIRPTRRVEQARSVNVDATSRLLDMCGAMGVDRFVYLSSTTVYGAHPDYRRPYREDDPVRPVAGFVYAEHKLAVEEIIAGHAAAHPSFRPAVLRGCVVMGPGADNFITESLGMRLLPAPAAADPPMQFLHIDDFAGVLAGVVESGIAGTYNVAGRGTLTWREMVGIAGGRVVPVPGPVLAGVVEASWALHLQTRSRASGLAFIRFPWLASTDGLAADLGWRAAATSRRAVEAWAEGRSVPRNVTRAGWR